MGLSHSRLQLARAKGKGRVLAQDRQHPAAGGQRTQGPREASAEVLAGGRGHVWGSLGKGSWGRVDRDAPAVRAYLLVPLGAVPRHLHCSCGVALGSLQEPGHQPAGAPADLQVPQGAGRCLRQLLRHLLGHRQLVLPHGASAEQRGRVTVRTVEQAGLRAQPCRDAAVRCQATWPCPCSPRPHCPCPHRSGDPLASCRLPVGTEAHADLQHPIAKKGGADPSRGCRNPPPNPPHCFPVSAEDRALTCICRGIGHVILQCFGIKYFPEICWKHKEHIQSLALSCAAVQPHSTSQSPL